MIQENKHIHATGLSEKCFVLTDVFFYVYDKIAWEKEAVIVVCWQKLSWKGAVAGFKSCEVFD